jgi:ABC-type sugar transport system substrate-binding protein
MRLKCFIFALLMHFQSAAESLNITFIVPDQNRPTFFWSLVHKVAQSMAEDVDVELEVYYSDNNRFASRAAIKTIISRENKPDYIVFRPFQGNAVEIFDLLESSNIPFVTLEQAFGATEASLIGEPRQKYTSWLGQINYDDFAGGTLLTSALYKHHQKLNPKHTMLVTGIGGDFDQVSMARQANLDYMIGKSGGFKVTQIFPMQWSPYVVRDRFLGIYQRYPKTNTFWCAGDLMAIEVINQLDQIGWPKKNKVLIGGFDWLPEALEQIHQGKMTASVGGHFLMASKAILNIVEYHHGYNVFDTDYKAEQYELIDSDNIDIYLPFMKQAPWPNIDFSQFSRVKSKQPQTKKLTVANVLDAYLQMSEQTEK